MKARAARLAPLTSSFLVGIGAFSAVGDQLVDAAIDLGNRHRSERQHSIVKGFQVELRPQPLFGAPACIDKGEFADIIAERLSGPRDVAIDFGTDPKPGTRGVVVQVVLPLFPAPPPPL